MKGGYIYFGRLRTENERQCSERVKLGLAGIKAGFGEGVTLSKGEERARMADRGRHRPDVAELRTHELLPFTSSTTKNPPSRPSGLSTMLALAQLK